jgi:hypothetical protein
MKLARAAAVPRLFAGIALCSTFSLSIGPLASRAGAQEPEGSLDLDGEWRFDTEEIVRITQDGDAVRGAFLDGAECLGGEVRPYFLDGTLSGTSLSGRMMVCSRSPRLVEECGISSMYETTFEATVEPGRIAGTRVAQGLATEEENGRYVSCVPDSRYDGTYDFQGTSCSGAERELAELTERLDSMVAEVNAIADELHATPRLPWFDEAYTGLNADQAARAREIGREMLELDVRIDATEDPAETADLAARMDALAAEGAALEEMLNAMNLTNWLREDYVGPNAELAIRYRGLEEEVVALLPRIDQAMARVAECASEGCPSPAEGQELLARADAMIAEINAIADELHATPRFPWFHEDYAGPNADQGARYREIEREIIELGEQWKLTQDPAERADIEAQIDALAPEMSAIEDVMNPMNVTNWTREDYTGPKADLATRMREMEIEVVEIFGQFNAMEQRRRECAEPVG